MDREDSTQGLGGGANASPWGGLRSATAGLLVSALLGLTLLAPGPAAAQLYTFIDERGVTHFTNLPPRDPRYKPVPPRMQTGLSFGRVPNYWGYDGLIGLTAAEHQVQPALVKAVIAAESNFNSAAVSQKGAQGLMQLMPQTAEQLGVSDPFVPSDNVRGGTRYLRSMLDRYGDLSRALAAYNAGPTAVDRYGGVPPFQETRDYVAKVLNYYRAYHGDFGR